MIVTRASVEQPAIERCSKGCHVFPKSLGTQARPGKGTESLGGGIGYHHQSSKTHWLIDNLVLVHVGMLCCKGVCSMQSSIPSVRWNCWCFFVLICFWSRHSIHSMHESFFVWMERDNSLIEISVDVINSEMPVWTPFLQCKCSIMKSEKEPSYKKKLCKKSHRIYKSGCISKEVSPPQSLFWGKVPSYCPDTGEACGVARKPRRWRWWRSLKLSWWWFWLS